jgi:NTP pyrophosphatase (non-canonical NTP hydrolase)
MNFKEYLFVCLAEELSESAQEAAKCLRFTPEHTPVGIYPTSNVERLQVELAQVVAVSELLKIHCNIDLFLALTLKFKDKALDDVVTDKMRRTIEGAKISVKLGALDACPN